MSKVLIALSGGVDSAVAALLLQEQGYDLAAATMSVLPPGSHQTCANQEDLDMARQLAADLNIPFALCDYQAEFRQRVIEPFAAAYEEGLTPNPCVECNRLMKFDLLYQLADQLGCDKVATGHYVQVKQDPESGRWLLYRAADLHKDQSYVLYSLSQDQLSRTLFPLGSLTKTEVRALAHKAHLPNQNKAESQDICFIPDGDYVRFLEDYRGEAYPPGDFVNLQGDVLGQHKGLVSYTVGQRRGLGLAHKEPWYVYRLDKEKNQVILAEKADLICRGLIADRVNLVSVAAIEGEMEVEVTSRYHEKPAPGKVKALDQSRVQVTFVEDHKMVAPGQSMVMYQGNLLVGGGRIVEAF